MVISHLLQGLRSKSGNAAIEFVFIAPLLVLLMSAIIEIGLAVRTNYALQEALLSGANQASHKGWDTVAIRNAITSSSPALKLTTEQITLERFCGCPVGTNIVQKGTCDEGPAPGNCTEGCSGICQAENLAEGSDGLAVRKYARLTARPDRQTVFKRSFGLPSTLSATMTTRLR